MAVPYSCLSDNPSDGTVLLGVRFAKKLIETAPVIEERNSSWGRAFPLAIVIAHELGHILQYKEGAQDSWEMEIHADFMAGWGIVLLMDHTVTQRGERRTW